jgi:sarcosine reductase
MRKLQLAEFPVRDVQFGSHTDYENGVLTIDKEEIRALILEDNRIVSAELDIALPGERTRIVNCRDVIEPRVKVDGPGSIFPGTLGPVEVVGQGTTHRLSGITVLSSCDYHSTIPSGTAAGSSSFLDMWGPGAAITPFSSSINLVLTLRIIDNASEWDIHSAIQLAGFKTGSRLAETTRGMVSDKIERFELMPVNPSLPRVVYIFSCCTIWQAPHTGLAYYGLPLRETLPILVHPNEFLDGALTSDARRGNGGFLTTWALMNNPAVLRLLRDHGKQLNFLGVILERTEFPTEVGKKVAAATTSNLANMLGADCAILTRLNPSGNSFIEVMLTVQSCVKSGVKTILMIPEWGGIEGIDLPLLFYVPEATAMISTGSMEREIRLPKPTKVIGLGEHDSIQLYPGDPSFSPWDELVRDQRRDILGGIDWFGGMSYTCKEY